MRSRILRSLAQAGVAVLLGTSAFANNVDVTLNPAPPLGLGDDTVFTIDGKPGDIPFIIWSNSNTPTMYPQIGVLDLGPPVIPVQLPPIPASGTLDFLCPIPCAFTGPAYSYVATIEPTLPITITAVSDQILITVDVGDINDCDGNGIDDDCECEVNPNCDCDDDGLIDACEEDCNNNSIPDDCEAFPDCDMNGVPDSCQPDCDGDGLPDVCESAGDCDMNGVPDDCQPDCDSDGLPDACEEDCDADGVPDDCEICGATGSVLYTMENCVAGSDADFFDELTGTVSDCPDVVVSASTLTGDEHSCSNDAVTDLGGQSICLIARPEADFDVNDPKTMRFTVTINNTPGSGKTVRIDELSMWTLSPDIGIISTPNSESMFANCPPQFYGIRILKDGSEVWADTAIPLTNVWRLDSFEFDTNPDFVFGEGTTTLDFEILAYDPPCAVPFRVWDLDEIRLDYCCDAVGGTTPDCSNP